MPPVGQIGVQKIRGQLSIGSPQLSEIPEVRLWLDDVQQRMLRVFARSNLYNALAVVYEELGVFGTGAMFVTEDDKEIVRAYPHAACALTALRESACCVPSEWRAGEVPAL